MEGSTERSGERGLALRRCAAFAVDWLVIAAWGGLLFAVAMLASGGEPGAPRGPWVGQAIGLVTMTLPVLLYFSVLESSRWRGSLGRRALGLRVETPAGERLPLRRALLRNAIKLAPWELGHLGAQQAFFAGDELPTWVGVVLLASMLGPLVWVAAIVATGRAPYDRAAGSRVVRGHRGGVALDPGRPARVEVRARPDARE